MTVCSTAARGGPVYGVRPCPVMHRTYASTGSRPSMSMGGTAMHRCRRRRGSSGATPGCRPACRGPASSRGAADGTLNACGGRKVGPPPAPPGQVVESPGEAEGRHVGPAETAPVQAKEQLNKGKQRGHAKQHPPTEGVPTE
jgi:hypothetical protein